MQIPVSPSSGPDPRDTMKNFTLKKILRLCPEAESSQHLIQFIDDGKKLRLDLALLPPALALKIAALLD